MKRPPLGTWIGPTFLGPLLACLGYVTVSIWVFGQTDGLLGTPFWNWVISALFSATLALVLGLVLSFVDLLLLSLGMRGLPRGPSAWASAVAATIGVGALSTLWPPGQQDTCLGWLFVAVSPMVSSAVLARLLLGRRP